MSFVFLKGVGEQTLLRLFFPLLLFSLFFNLHVVPFNFAEPRRAIVAMEMIYRQNYWVSTIYNDFYYAKPPLFGWMLVGVIKVFGTSEAAFRSVAVVSLLGMALLNYYFCKEYIDKKIALISSIFIVLSGDAYFFFSTLCEIDFTYSLVTFASFVVIYHFCKTERWWLLFLLTYFLCWLGFMLKGLPSFVFTALTLLVAFISEKRFWKLFHPAHFAGIGLLLLLTGGYFYMYSQYNGVTKLYEIIYQQSAEKTVLQNSWESFVKMLVWFPVDLLKCLLPASLMLFFIPYKSAWQQIQGNSFLRFCYWCLVVNLIPYWLSPQSASRYLYMLYPAAITLLVYFFHQRFNLHGQMLRVLTVALLIVLGRIAFDAFVLPARASSGEIAREYRISQDMLKLANGARIRFIGHKADFNFPISVVYELEKHQKQVVDINAPLNKEDRYICFTEELPQQTHEVLYRFDWGGRQCCLVKMLE